MKIIPWSAGTKLEPHPDSVNMSIGVFDGIHLGHKTILHSLLEKKEKSCVVTFKDNPKKVLYPDRYLGCIHTLDQRLEMMDRMGIDLCLLIDFSKEFSKMEGGFFLSLLMQSFQIRSITVGDDFHFGKGRDSSARSLSKYSSFPIPITLAPAVKVGHQRVGSSDIRKLILRGMISRAEDLLGEKWPLVINPQDAETPERMERNVVSQILPEKGCFSVTSQNGYQGKANFTQFYIHFEPPLSKTSQKDIFFLKEKGYVPF